MSVLLAGLVRTDLGLSDRQMIKEIVAANQSPDRRSAYQTVLEQAQRLLSGTKRPLSFFNIAGFSAWHNLKQLHLNHQTKQQQGGAS